MLHKGIQDGLVMKTRNSQCGMALLILVFFLTMIAAGYVLQSLSAVGIKNERDKKTATALAEAKMALIGWSASHATMPGTLPCPDRNTVAVSNGNSSACTNTTGIIGRLPWKTLGIGDIRDGDGECLWYAVSPIYRNTISVASRATVTNRLNNTVPGTIVVRDANGVNLPAPVNPVIAVIISPGSSLAGQSHAGGIGQCGANNTASNYLDSANGVNNATGNVSGTNYIFTSGANSSTFNDKVVYITAEELYRALRKRMVKEILGNLDVPAGAVDYYNNNGNNYPCPSATPTGVSDCSLTTGFLNSASTGMALAYTPSALKLWLANNNWFASASYTYMDSTDVELAVTDTLGSYRCLATSNVFSCSSP